MTVNVFDAARVICAQRYPDAAAAFAAGSLMRGEGTRYSDLDLVVVYSALPAAYRESFRLQGLPVEAFVHDPETLEYCFVEMDAALCARYCGAFESLFRERQIGPIVRLAEELLEPHGGLLFEGYRSDAPHGWRNRPTTICDGSVSNLS